MKLSEYFAQPMYFSESSQEMVAISEMPYSHAYYAHKKLEREHGKEYVGTRLHYQFLYCLCPSTGRLMMDLQRYGKVAIMPTQFCLRGAARERLYRAGKFLGTKVTTRWNEKWFEGEIVTPTVRVKGEQVA